MNKIFKIVGASIGMLVTAYGIGWSGAMVIHKLFVTDRVEAKEMVIEIVDQREAKIMAIHQSDMEGLNGKIGILVEQNKTIMQQNTEILKRVK